MAVTPSEPGIIRCLQCRYYFVSPDPERVRRCLDCKIKEEPYQPRTAKISDISERIEERFR